MLSRLIIFFLILIPLSGWLFFQGGNLFLGGIAILIYSFYTLGIIIFRTTSIESKNKKLLENLNQKNNELTIKIRHSKFLEKKLKKSATHDLLTELPNRLLFLDRVNQAILRSKRSDHTFGLVFIDLDHFKRINDNFGHDIGDQVLQAVANRLTVILRAEDTVSRMGGDEFILLINNLSQEKDLQPIAKKVLQNLSTPYQIEEHSLTCTGSMGIVLFPTDGSTSRELIRNADRAMYQAKNKGGNCFRFYSTQEEQTP